MLVAEIKRANARIAPRAGFTAGETGRKYGLLPVNDGICPHSRQTNQFSPVFIKLCTDHGLQHGFKICSECTPCLFIAYFGRMPGPGESTYPATNRKCKHHRSRNRDDNQQPGRNRLQQPAINRHLSGEFSGGDKRNPDGFAGDRVRIRNVEWLQPDQWHHLYGLGLGKRRCDLHGKPPEH